MGFGQISDVTKLLVMMIHRKISPNLDKLEPFMGNLDYFLKNLVDSGYWKSQKALDYSI